MIKKRWLLSVLWFLAAAASAAPLEFFSFEDSVNEHGRWFQQNAAGDSATDKRRIDLVEIARDGRRGVRLTTLGYDVNVHSGNVRFGLSNPSGFELSANTFSGNIRSELPLTIGGDPRDRDGNGRRRGMSNRSMRATFGDGSATLTLRTFSGDIVIAKR